MAIPLDGQGKPLPRDFGYDGEWLIENLMFLYRSEPDQLGGPRLLAHGVAGEKQCFGVDAAQLAAGLKIDTDELFDANREGDLELLTVEKVNPTRGGIRAKRYVFAIGDQMAEIFIEAGGLTGSA